MNVFVLCTGRCGSVTFAKACEHMANYSVGHESRDGLLGNERVNYSDNHLEVDNRLAWYLGRLDKAYGHKAFYVHLTRDRMDTMKSFARKSELVPNYSGARVLDHYVTGIARAECSLKDGCADYIDNVTANITQFLKDKPRIMGVQLERISDQFPIFWERIGAEGDLGKALDELKVRHNKS